MCEYDYCGTALKKFTTSYIPYHLITLFSSILMFDPQYDEKTEEDKIIDLIEMEGSNALFEDTDFIPNRQSLYENEGFIPFYDVDHASMIVWRRPHDIVSYPCYFSESFGNPYVIQGT